MGILSINEVYPRFDTSLNFKVSFVLMDCCISLLFTLNKQQFFLSESRKMDDVSN